MNEQTLLVNAENIQVDFKTEGGIAQCRAMFPSKFIKARPWRWSANRVLANRFRPRVDEVVAEKRHRGQATRITLHGEDMSGYTEQDMRKIRGKNRHDLSGTNDLVKPDLYRGRSDR